MKDETIGLLAKMYSEFSERFDSMEKRFGGMENRIDRIANGQRKLETLIENDVKKDIMVLYNGYNQVYEKVVVIE